MNLEADYWNERYVNGNTGWDIGYPSTPIKEYADQLPLKDIRILIPGAGNSYEAEYLWEQGFKNVFVLDISKEAISKFEKRVPSFPKNQLLLEDFFNHEGVYDLILEQTFFCAVLPERREELVSKASQLLLDGGKHVGLLFNFPLVDGPPFGGTLKEYQGYFESFFDKIRIEKCLNSIKPRMGKEYFFIAEKF